VQVDGQVEHVQLRRELLDEARDPRSPRLEALLIGPPPHPELPGAVEQRPRVRGLRDPQHRVVQLPAHLLLRRRHLRERGTGRRPGLLAQIEVRIEVQHTPALTRAGPETRADQAQVRGPRRLVPAAEHHGQPRPGPVQRRRRERRGRGLPALEVLAERLRATQIGPTHLAAGERAGRGGRRERRARRGGGAAGGGGPGGAPGEAGRAGRPGPPGRGCGAPPRRGGGPAGPRRRRRDRGPCRAPRARRRSAAPPGASGRARGRLRRGDRSRGCRCRGRSSSSRLLVCSPGGWIRPSWHRRGWHADRTMTTPKVPAADATLRLLTFLASRRSPVPAARIAAELGLPRSRTYDLLSTLVEHGYVLHLDQERQYGLGPAAHELSGAYL